ncbi:MAG: flagellar basal body-associated FliL family protein, partial [Deltaproteobacteria bacterium]|nr:flagellar basal body-associated FliL family protein [Deltaproteobacteria bacterium]
GAHADAPRPNRKKIFIIGGIGAAAVAAVGIGLFFFLNSGKGGATKEAAAHNAPAKEGAHGKERGKEGKGGSPLFFPLEPFILNLADIDSNRYLKISVTLELSEPRATQEAEGRIPQIRDAMILLMSSLTYGDIHSIEGKITLQSEIQNRLNKILETGTVKRVYFTDLVVQ